MEATRIATATRNPTPPRHRLRPPRIAAPLLAGAAAALLVGAALAGEAGAAGWAPAGSLAGLGDGRIWQVVFAPGDPLLAAAATDNGVYVSLDGGNTWSSSGLHGSRAWAVAIQSGALGAETLYAGLAGSGIRVSTDEGKTWTDSSSGLPNLDVRDIAVTTGGLAAGTDDGVALSATGSTWYAGGLTGDSISAVAGIPGAPGPVFYAGVDYPNTGKSYLYRRDPTSGLWTAVTAGLPSGDVVDSISIGATTESITANPILVTTAKGTYRSGDGGITWTASNGIPQNTYLTDAVYSPLDPNLVYAGADAGGSSGGGLFRSTDGGQTFTAANQGLPTDHSSGEPARQEVESVAVAPGQPYATVIAALDPYQGDAAVYVEVDTGAPSPPVLTTASASAGTLPASALGTPTPTVQGAPGQPQPTPTPSSSLIGGVAGAVFHFPTPLIFELAFVVLVVALFVRWRRHYYVDGPP
ncbi:MAG: WD40/YVTN/BNR-like repeat-containing protein [Candidatus Dormibacteria bacterium]